MNFHPILPYLTFFRLPFLIDECSHCYHIIFHNLSGFDPDGHIKLGNGKRFLDVVLEILLIIVGFYVCTKIRICMYLIL